MCGRFGRDIPWSELQATLDLVRPAPGEAPNLEPEWDIRPTTAQWIARVGADGGRELVRARWGLVPSWAAGKALRDFKLTTFNAKAKTVANAATFKAAFARRRCLVPASCWYEWTGPKGSKAKRRFIARDEPWLCFAGVWDRCATSDVGEVESFTIVTQPAGAALNGYHDRAPVVVARSDWGRWLDTADGCQDLLRAKSADRFDAEAQR